MKTTFPLVLPQISINGTNRTELVAQQLAVLGALRNLEATLAEASPHRRDYQHDPSKLPSAVSAWVERRTMIVNFRREIEKHAEAILAL